MSILESFSCFVIGLFILICFISFSSGTIHTPPIYVDRPHGVPLAKKSFYDPEQDFSCIDNSKIIPFEWVNDDFCDCADGTDEPGTAACSNGIFHCINLGHVSKNIPSSRVNDYVCDCCDGSDEWTGRIKCNDTCRSEGEAARVAAEKEIQIAKDGFQKRQNMAAQGAKTKQEKKAKLDELQKEKEAVEIKRQELEAKKKEIEAKEDAEKTAHREKWEKEKAARQAAKDRELGTNLFNSILDYNKDGNLAVEELRMRKELFAENSAELGEAEALEYLGGRQQVDLETFLSEVYSKISYRFPQKVPEPAVQPAAVTEAPVAQPSDDEKIPTDVTLPPPTEPVAPAQPDEDVMPEYSADTKQLIQEADIAREEYGEVDRKFLDLESEMNKLNDFLNLDLGVEVEFADLVANCFEVQVQQYTYKFCPFDKTTQRPTDGSGSETTLGYWGKWDDTLDVANKYLKQIYERGTSCWNGPDRKTEVVLRCGPEHQLTSATEPAKCEYLFTFQTPLVCEEPKLHSPHTEL